MFGGLGLGLSIVKRLVELQGGTVEARSAGEHRGACFVVCLPIAFAAGRSADTAAPERKAAEANAFDFQHADLTGIRILVVDDEADTRELVARVLSECNAIVTTSANAQEALAILEERAPDLLISDIGMPDVDGYELLRRIRAREGERGGRTPAIALTAFARSEDRTRALRAGFLMHLPKPIEPSELVATVASVAGRT
jgi:CheY-like chemotaxis protein